MCGFEGAHTLEGVPGLEGGTEPDHTTAPLQRVVWMVVHDALAAVATLVGAKTCVSRTILEAHATSGASCAKQNKKQTDRKEVMTIAQAVEI